MEMKHRGCFEQQGALFSRQTDQCHSVCEPERPRCGSIINSQVEGFTQSDWADVSVQMRPFEVICPR